MLLGQHDLVKKMTFSNGPVILGRTLFLCFWFEVQGNVYELCLVVRYTCVSCPCFCDLRIVTRD